MYAERMYTTGLGVHHLRHCRHLARDVDAVLEVTRQLFHRPVVAERLRSAATRGGAASGVQGWRRRGGGGDVPVEGGPTELRGRRRLLRSVCGERVEVCGAAARLEHGGGRRPGRGWPRRHRGPQQPQLGGPKHCAPVLAGVVSDDEACGRQQRARPRRVAVAARQRETVDGRQAVVSGGGPRGAVWLGARAAVWCHTALPAR